MKETCPPLKILATEDQNQTKDLGSFPAQLQCHVHFYIASTNIS